MTAVIRPDSCVECEKHNLYSTAVFGQQAGGIGPVLRHWHTSCSFLIAGVREPSRRPNPCLENLATGNRPARKPLSGEAAISGEEQKDRMERQSKKDLLFQDSLNPPAS